MPETEPDDEVTVEITNARENVAFARVHDKGNTSDESFDLDESFADDTLDGREWLGCGRLTPVRRKFMYHQSQ